MIIGGSGYIYGKPDPKIHWWRLKSAQQKPTVGLHHVTRRFAVGLSALLHHCIIRYSRWDELL